MSTRSVCYFVLIAAIAACCSPVTFATSFGNHSQLEAIGEYLDPAARFAAIKGIAKDGLAALVKKTPTILLEAKPDDFLCRICTKEGGIYYPSGGFRQKTCFMCRKYYQKDMQTSYECLQCGTALCIMDRERGMTCIYEHLNSSDPDLKCNGTSKSIFPPSKRSADYSAEPGPTTKQPAAHETESEAMSDDQPDEFDGEPDQSDEEPDEFDGELDQSDEEPDQSEEKPDPSDEEPGPSDEEPDEFDEPEELQLSDDDGTISHQPDGQERNQLSDSSTVAHEPNSPEILAEAFSFDSALDPDTMDLVALPI